MVNLTSNGRACVREFQQIPAVQKVPE
uniref:Uncharacterized protein n=1 Tax=Anguilla anguilla TaxID=7936 RepID=A0A0E9TEN3_ANGAN